MKLACPYDPIFRLHMSQGSDIALSGFDLVIR
jgi:hypothetical protein